MDGNSTKKGNRSSERAVFPLQENVTGFFSHLWMGEESNPFAARILNLSEGGLHFVLKKEGKTRFRVGDRLLLKWIEGSEKLTFCTELELEIKWILDSDYLDHYGFGCQYQKIPEKIKDKIVQFVASARESKNKGI